MNILITAGPTYEYIDPVRFISNPSSGKMGFAVAEAAKARGHNVLLISGPTNLKPPHRVEFISVVSADEMLKAVLEAYKYANAVIMTAAVSDYMPIKVSKSKLKKGAKSLSLKLARTADILSTIGKKKGGRILVGFALETDDMERNAIKKLKSKNLDYIIVNDPSSFGADTLYATILGRNGYRAVLKNITKNSLAKKIVGLVERQV